MERVRGWFGAVGAGPEEERRDEGPVLGKSGKKICCSCPETRKPRDECIVLHGEDACAKLIEAHKVPFHDSFITHPT